MKKLTILFFIIFVTLSSSVLTYAKPKGTINSQSYILTSVSNGTVLYQKNINDKFKPLEFSKMMVALIISESIDNNKLVAFDDSPAFYNEYGNIAGVKEGLRYTVKEHLFNMLLLHSDASAVALAKEKSGSVDKFVEEMNKKAKELGMNSTFYVSASGNDNENKSFTTVSDTAILARKIYSDKNLMDIFSTVLFKLPDTSGELKQYSCRNHLISKYTYDKYNYSCANGLIASPSGDYINLAATASKQNTDLIVIAAKCKNDADLSIYRDAINLFEYGYNQFGLSTICAEGDAVAEISVPSASPNKLILTTETAVKALLPYDYDKNLITTKINAPESTTPPVKKGQKLGTIDYYYNENYVATTNLITSKKASFNIFSFLHDNIFNNFNTIPLLILIIVILIFIQIKHKENLRKKKRRKKKNDIMNQIK